MSTLSTKVQLAAVLALLEEGSTLEQIERDHPEFAAGVKAQRDKPAKKDDKRGSGPDRPLPSTFKAFTV